ncbi:hypothetical protein H4582DRAFT_212233 [Lactarius indigo]|nr:hypothetical protein H4582DRAFT_212233 [Lactarius indigo]
MSVFYIQFATARIKGFQLWLPIFQQTIGKLYVISLFYMIPYNRTSGLQPSCRLSLFQRRPCIHSRGKPRGETLRAVILRQSVEGKGPSTFLYSRLSPFFKPLQFYFSFRLHISTTSGVRWMQMVTRMQMLKMASDHPLPVVLSAPQKYSRYSRIYRYEITIKNKNLWRISTTMRQGRGGSREK